VRSENPSVHEKHVYCSTMWDVRCGMYWFEIAIVATSEHLTPLPFLFFDQFLSFRWLAGPFLLRCA